MNAHYVHKCIYHHHLYMTIFFVRMWMYVLHIRLYILSNLKLTSLIFHHTVIMNNFAQAKGSADSCSFFVFLCIMWCTKCCQRVCSSPQHPQAAWTQHSLPVQLRVLDHLTLEEVVVQYEGGGTSEEGVFRAGTPLTLTTSMTTGQADQFTLTLNGEVFSSNTPSFTYTFPRVSVLLH